MKRKWIDNGSQMDCCWIGGVGGNFGLIGGVDKDLGWIGQRFGSGLGRGLLGWKSVGNGLAYEPAGGGMKVVCK